MWWNWEKERGDKSVVGYLVNFTPDTDTDYALGKATKRLKQPTVTELWRWLSKKWPRKSGPSGPFWTTSWWYIPTAWYYLWYHPRVLELKCSTYQVFLPMSGGGRARPPKSEESAWTRRRLGGNAGGTERYIVMLLYIFNVILLLHHVPLQWKQAKIIMIHKAEKPAKLPGSYRSISLLSIIRELNRGYANVERHW